MSRGRGRLSSRPLIALLSRRTYRFMWSARSDLLRSPHLVETLHLRRKKLYDSLPFQTYLTCLQNRWPRYHRPRSSPKPSASSSPWTSLACRRRAVVPFRRTRELGCQYGKSEGAGMELEYARRLLPRGHRAHTPWAYEGDHRYQLLGTSSGYAGNMRSGRLCTLLGLAPAKAASPYFL